MVSPSPKCEDVDFADVQIGTRFEVDSHRGTILYKGAIPATKGVWLGVEWDDPSRGKHDGSHEGVHYFTTSHPTSGSFIRFKKANFGVSFLEAVQERYGRIDDENAGIILEEMYVKGKNQRTTVEVVGAKSVNMQQSQLEHLREVSLSAMYVSCAGPEGAIKTILPSVEQLDICHTLLPSWHRLCSITRQLDKLQTLNVSNNRLKLPEDPAQLDGAFSNLQVLSINRTRTTWDQIIELTLVMPKLQTLHSCYNQMTSFSVPSGYLQSLRLLNLEGNDIQVWEKLLPLSDLPNLEELILNSTGIDQVEFPDVPPGGTTKYFAHLRSLSLSRNNIQDWKSISEMDKLVCFENLKLSFNPITENHMFNEETVRSFVIATISRLKVFNRSLVLSVERRGAEIDYLKMFGPEWKEAGGHQDPKMNKPSQDFSNKYPRYQAFIDLYGAPEDSELVKKSSALRGNLISVVIDCPLRPDMPPQTKKLPVTMTLQKLKGLVARRYKADLSRLYLTYTSTEVPGQEFPMDNDLREIGFFALEEGDTINVKWQ